MQLHATIAALVYPRPLVIAGHRFDGQQVLRLTIAHGRHRAHAEAAGVFYRGDTAAELLAQARALSIGRDTTLPEAWRLLASLPAGGVRNALDWALWQLEAAARGWPTWQLAHLDAVRPLLTTITLSVDTPEAMADAACRHSGARALKLKLDGGDADPHRVASVRAARPDVRLMVDANQGWTLDQLERWVGTLADCGVELIEQPLSTQDDHLLTGRRFPIPLAADESLQTLADLARVAERYQVANIKLDKCGGLSEALVLAHAARRLGMTVMVGCMGGSSMAMRAAFIAGQFADLLDLDAPLIIENDVSPAARYDAGFVSIPSEALNAES